MRQPETQNRLTFAQGGYLGEAARAFLLDRRAGGASPRTIRFYTGMLRQFSTYCRAQSLTAIQDIQPDFLRGFLLAYSETHAPGTVGAMHRSLRAFFNWLADEEVMPAGWRNPIEKVRAPRESQDVLPPVELDDVSALIASCKDGRHGDRDRAIFLTLLDTGVRASELCGIDLADVDFSTGAVTVRHGKGDKARTVFIGRKTRRALRAYLRTRTDNCPALFVTRLDDRMAYTGLREILRRRARDAGLDGITLHSFRRAFALAMLRNGADIFSLQRLMGHADLAVLRRYLAQNDTDTRAAHEKYSPVGGLR